MTWLVQRADTDGKYVPLHGSRGRNVSLAEWVTRPYLAAVLCPLLCSWLGAGAYPHLGSAQECFMPAAYFLLPSLMEVLQGFSLGLGRKRNGDACPYSWLLPPRAAPALGNAGGVQCVMRCD